MSPEVQHKLCGFWSPPAESGVLVAKGTKQNRNQVIPFQSLEATLPGFVTLQKVKSSCGFGSKNTGREKLRLNFWQVFHFSHNKRRFETNRENMEKPGKTMEIHGKEKREKPW